MAKKERLSVIADDLEVLRSIAEAGCIVTIATDDVKSKQSCRRLVKLKLLRPQPMMVARGGKVLVEIAYEARAAGHKLVREVGSALSEPWKD